jgi:arginase
MKTSRIVVIGAPLDLGSHRRGVDMGPSALRVANLNARLAALGYQVEDLGNVPVRQREATPEGTSEVKYLAQIAATCERLGQMVYESLKFNQSPLVIGGDHSIATGTVAGVSKYFHDRGQKLGLIWIDAHADMNTPESSRSGNVHGMPLACCIGRGPVELTNILGFSPKVAPQNVALVGIRDIDKQERVNIRESGIAAFTMRDIDERGLQRVMSEAIAIASNGTAGFHLSLDLDYVDPTDAPGVGTPVRGGATYREAHLAMEMINDSGCLVSMEAVEVNPVLDEANRTADLAVELILSALGKKIL